MDAEDISYQILREITDGFSEEQKLGQGSIVLLFLYGQINIFSTSLASTMSALEQYMVLYK